MTLNVWGLGKATRDRALSHLSTRPHIILLQETMCTELVAMRKLSSILPGWEFSAMDAVGHSGGLLVGWNPIYFSFQTFKTQWGLLLNGNCLCLKLHLTILNLYGPYKHRGAFWDSLRSSGILNFSNLMVASDLNFTRHEGDI